MASARDSVAFVVNGIPEQNGRTRYQHASALSDTFSTTIICRGHVPPEIEDLSDSTYSYPEARCSQIPFVFPIWLFCISLIERPDAFVVSPHSSAVIATYLLSLALSTDHVVDFWDGLSLPIESYRGLPGAKNCLFTAYHTVMYRLATYCLRWTDLIVLSMHPGILDRYDLTSVPVLELTNGFDPGLLQYAEADGSDNGDVRVVYLGRANAKRGIDAMFKALTDLDEGFHLDVVGPTDDAVKQAVRDVERVTLHGQRPYEEAIEFVSRADIGLCTIDTSVQNYRYSYPIKLFEYAALETAIVASDTPAVQSILTADESVRLVDEQSAEQLWETVSELANDEEDRRDLGRNANEEIQEYAWPKVLEPYTAGIQEHIGDDTSDSASANDDGTRPEA